MYTREPDLYTKPYKINTEGQEMESYQIFVVPVVNTKIAEELDLQVPKDSVTLNNKKEKLRDDLDD